MALIGSITNYGSLQGEVNGYGNSLTGEITEAVTLGGEIVGMRGLKGDKGDQGDTGATGADGQDGADGFSPSASVSKAGDTTTITITDKDGTTTASVYDGETNVQSDWNEADSTDDAYIKNKPTLGEAAAKGVDIIIGSSIVSDKLPTTNAVKEYVDTGFQPKLVSGTNIKTINNNSLLGSGNINIQGGGGSAFVAEYGVTTYADVKDAYDEDAIILCTVDDSGNTAICQLVYFDDANDAFSFAQPVNDGFYLASIASNDTWEDGYFHFASTDTATQLRDGLMSALDWQKLDGIASGAEVNVQSDWNEADSTDDAYIKNKPTIPTKVSDLNNDSGFLTAETDPVFSASDAAGITSSDISNWNGKADAVHTHTKADITDYPTGVLIKTASKQSGTITVPANAVGSDTVDMSSVKPDGYTLIGVAGFYCVASGAPPISVSISATDTASVSFRNVTSSSVNQKITVVGLYLRDAI